MLLGIEGGTDIRTLQELLGHADVKTTEIYTHTVKHGNGKGVRSPFDGLGDGGGFARGGVGGADGASKLSAPMADSQQLITDD